MKMLPRNIPSQSSPLSAFLSNDVPDILTNAAKQEKEA